MNDVTFFKLSKTCEFLTPLPLNASKKELLGAVASKLRISDQKNKFKGACVYHGALEGYTFSFPVKALERQVAHIRKHTSDGDMLCVPTGTASAGGMLRIGI